MRVGSKIGENFLLAKISSYTVYSSMIKSWLYGVSSNGEREEPPSPKRKKEKEREGEVGVYVNRVPPETK